MTPEEQSLYDKIDHFQLDQPNVVCPFSVKLAWQYRWSGIFTHRAIREYKKYIFLLMVTDRTLSPTTTIDRVWHQHILYTRSYWEDLCGQVLNRPLHHTPGLGGADEGMKYYRQCSAAIALYQKYFGNPPTDIWASPNLRVESIRYQWINRDRYWVIPKPNITLKS